MKFGFNKIDIKKGGQYEDLFYNNVIIEGRRIKRLQGKIAVEINEDDVAFVWLRNNKDNLNWEGLGIYVEAPVSFKSNNVPPWLPNNTYIDENDVEQTHTFESWGGVVRESLDNTKIMLNVTIQGDINASSVDTLITLVDGNANLEAYLVKEARDIVNSPDYQVPEV